VKRRQSQLCNDNINAFEKIKNKNKKGGRQAQPRFNGLEYIRKYENHHAKDDRLSLAQTRIDAQTAIDAQITNDTFTSTMPTQVYIVYYTQSPTV
jgi:hypothetical protein